MHNHWYNRAGDCLEFHFTEQAYYAERVDGVLTVYRSQDDDALVGCQVKGISALIAKFGDFGLQIKTDELRLALLFCVSHIVGEDSYYEAPRRHKLYNDLLSRFGKTTVNVCQSADA